GKTTTEAVLARSRSLLADLTGACEELKAKGITDRSKVLAPATASVPVGQGIVSDHAAALDALAAAFAKVQSQADGGDGAAAAATLGEDGYFVAFEPLERELQVREPGAVQPLEARFNLLRGAIGQGLKGSELATKLGDLRADIAATVARLD